MKRLMISLIVAVCICIAPNVRAADDGQTQPKINYAMSTSVTAIDIVGPTNGSGNVKGVQCLMYPSFGQRASALVKFYVNGGAAQSVTIDSGFMPSGDATDTTRSSGWVPFNVRFTTSIRITLQKDASIGDNIFCAVSWALD